MPRLIKSLKSRLSKVGNNQTQKKPEVQYKIRTSANIRRNPFEANEDKHKQDKEINNSNNNTKKSMFNWGNKDSKTRQPEVYENVAFGLKSLYRTKLLPLEEAYRYHDFHSPAMNDPDFDSKPMVLLIGQYSTGKTTFIKYLLDSDFPGIRIGPEPTTDRFIAVMHGQNEGVIPGNALVVDNKKQFKPLSKFGNTFLNRLQCSTLNNKVCFTYILL